MSNANTTATKTLPARDLAVGMRTEHTEITKIERIGDTHVRVTTTSRTGEGFAGARYYKLDTEVAVLDDFAVALPAVGDKIVADNGRTYVVESVHESGPNTKRVQQCVAMLGVKLDSKRARATYAANLFANGTLSILFSV